MSVFFSDFEESLIKKIILLSLEEDRYDHDITSDLTIPKASLSRADILAKQEGIWCGNFLIERIIKYSGSSLKFSPLIQDGEAFKVFQALATLEGSTRTLLSLERTILNFVQRLSAISSFTHKVVKAAPRLKILDTRKTTPGLRVLEKRAVLIGGGTNHRANLSDRILIKNNHIDGAGVSLDGMLTSVFSSRPAGIPIEVEVRNLEELQAVLSVVTPDFIMLDNFPNELIPRGIELVRARSVEIEIEVSGGIDENRLAFLDRFHGISVSMGALTNRVSSLDLSMRISDV